MRSFDTGIVYQSYNGRGLVTHRANTRALCRQSDGTLWAAVREALPGFYINIYQSTDNGFNWIRMAQAEFKPAAYRHTGVAGLNANGPFLQLAVFEHYDRLIVVESYQDSSLAQYNTEWFVYQMSTMKRLDATADPADTSVPALNTVATVADELSFQLPYNENNMFLTWVKAGSIYINAYAPTYQHGALSAVNTPNQNLTNVFGVTMNEHAILDFAIVQNDTANYNIMHYRYDYHGNTVTTGETIFAVEGKPYIVGMSMAHDGAGTLMAGWGQQDLGATDIDLYHSISTDLGETWTAPTLIPKSLGHTAYTDQATGQRDTRNSLLGGMSGFMVAYTRQNGSGIAKSFVRQITTTDNNNYVIQAEREVATTSARPQDPVTGIRFFYPTGAKLVNLDEPGYVRIAYQRGEANDTTQMDSDPVYFGQELLNLSAYPTMLISEMGSYTVESPNTFQLPVHFNIIGAPNTNQDYYAAGYTGRVTRRYLNAFRRLGNDIRVLRFEPEPESHLSDRMAFGPPTEFTTRVFFDSLTYDDPTGVQVGIDNFTVVTERDIRKIYFPPDFHISRTFTLNKGNFFKRTVWLVDWDGNEYEISQVVPNLVLDQIAYYSANAFVCGSNRDPFRRLVLPSET